MRIYYRRPKNEVEGTDSNRAMTRRDWMKLLGIGGLVIAGGYGVSKLIEYNPQEIEKMCNEVMRRNKDPDAVENIEERIARLTKELEDRVEYAKPIRTFDELNSVREHLDEDYRLECDVKCPKGHNWEPIGTPEKPFIGTFNGQGHTIYDLRAEWPNRNYVGMFGVVGINPEYFAIIANLKLENVLVHGYSYIGKLSGNNAMTFVMDCHTSGSSKGVLCIGGNTGASNGGILLRCSDKGPVDGERNVGGLIGMDGGSIVDSFSNDYVKKSETECKGSLAGFHNSEKQASNDFSERIINSPGEIGYDSYIPQKK